MISVTPIVTNAGQTLLLRALAGETLTFTKFKAGDGAMPAGSDGKTLTDLISVKKTFNISSSVRTSDNLRLSGSFSNATLEADFTFRELGVFAKIGSETETLYAYINNGENSVVIHADDTSIVMQQAYAFNINVGDAENVSATVDGVLYALAEHEHDADDITSGTLGAARGGTGVTSLTSLSAELNIQQTIVDSSDQQNYPWEVDGSPVFADGTEPDAYLVIDRCNRVEHRLHCRLEYYSDSKIDFTGGKFSPLILDTAFTPAKSVYFTAQSIDSNGIHTPLAGAIANAIGMHIMAWGDPAGDHDGVIFDFEYTIPVVNGGNA